MALAGLEFRVQSALQVHRGLKARPVPKDQLVPKEMMEPRARKVRLALKARLGRKATRAIRGTEARLAVMARPERTEQPASRVRKVQKATPAILVPLARRGFRDRQELIAKFPARPGHRVRKARWALLVRPALPGRKDRRVQREPLGPKAHRELRAIPEQPALRVQLAQRD
jgi:hypothetical protein